MKTNIFILFVLMASISSIALQAQQKSPAPKTSPTGSKTNTNVEKPKQVLIAFVEVESGLYGFKDSISDKVVIPAKYTYVNPFVSGLAAVNTGGEMIYDDYYSDLYFIGGKWGFINPKGIVVVPLKYAHVRSFSDGMAAVNLGGTVEYDDYSDEAFFSGGKWGFINTAGLVVVPVKYDEVQDFSGGFGTVIIGGKAGCVGKSGQTIIPFKYSGISTINKGTAIVWNFDSTYNSKYGLISIKGIALTPLAYDNLEYKEDGYYLAKKGELWGLINSAGKTIIPFKYSDIDYSCGYFRVTVNGLTGLLDKTGIQIYPPVNLGITLCDDDGFMTVMQDGNHNSGFHKSGLKFDQKFTFEGDVARIVQNGKYGLINRKAQFILPYKYDEIGYFNDTLAIAKLNGKQGYITISGKELIPCIYDNIGLFINNCAWVKLGTKQGYISPQGKEIIPIKYDEFYGAYPGCDLQKVRLNEKFGIVNRSLGANYELIPPKYDFIFDNGGDILKSNNGGVKNSQGYIDGGKWGIIDKQSGSEVTAPKYDYVWNYTDGLALVIVGGIFDPAKKIFQGGKYGFINQKGEEIIPVQFDVANSFKDGVASVTLNSVSYKINKQGQRLY